MPNPVRILISAIQFCFKNMFNGSIINNNQVALKIMTTCPIKLKK